LLDSRQFTLRRLARGGLCEADEKQDHKRDANPHVQTSHSV
jgi:hypothetical protein